MTPSNADEYRPPSGEFAPGAALHSERIARLEGEVDANGAGLERLEEMLKQQRESTEGLKRDISADRVQLASQLGEIRGGLRVLIALGSVALAVITIGLAVLGIILKH